jgi:isopenicillin-N epimerase
MNGWAPEISRGSEFFDRWALDPSIIFLNHGSFGACPRAVLEAQSEIRARMEAEPVRFFIRELPALLDAARSRLAGFLGCDTAALVFVANATTGVNTALAAVPLERGDEILVTDHGYAACRNAVDVVGRRDDAEVVEVKIPFPIATSASVIEAVVDRVSSRTRLAVIDHVTSPTGLVLPVSELVAELEHRGVVVIVDGAHAPGMLDLELDEIGASFYAGNCHKWICAPKGAGFLQVREDWRDRTRPLVTSHGYSAPLDGRSRFHLEFDWTGTVDPTAWLSVPTAIDALGSMVPGGWSEIRSRNRGLARRARSELCSALDVDPPCPEGMIGSMAAVALPGECPSVPGPAAVIHPLQERLFRDFAIEVPVTSWGSPRRWAIRASAHLYNSFEQYEALASALSSMV